MTVIPKGSWSLTKDGILELQVQIIGDPNIEGSFKGQISLRCERDPKEAGAVLIRGRIGQITKGVSEKENQKLYPCNITWESRTAAK